MKTKNPEKEISTQYERYTVTVVFSPQERPEVIEGVKELIVQSYTERKQKAEQWAI